MKALISFIVVVGSLTVIVLLIGYILKRIRSNNLSKVADKHDLFFSNGMRKFYIIGPIEYKRNIIKGVIRNHSVEIYDFINITNMWLPLGSPASGTFLPKRETVLIIDGRENRVRGFWSGFAPARKIDAFLSNLNR